MQNYGHQNKILKLSNQPTQKIHKGQDNIKQIVWNDRAIQDTTHRYTNKQENYVKICGQRISGSQGRLINKPEVLQKSQIFIKHMGIKNTKKLIHQY